MTKPLSDAQSQILTHVACWAHARRKPFEVHEATKSPIAAEAIERIGALYAVEAELLSLAREARQVRTKPLLIELYDWMEAQRRRLLGKSTLGKAL